MALIALATCQQMSDPDAGAGFRYGDCMADARGALDTLNDAGAGYDRDAWMDEARMECSQFLD